MKNNYTAHYLLDFLYLILSLHLAIALFYLVGMWRGGIDPHDASLLSEYVRYLVHLVT